MTLPPRFPEPQLEIVPPDDSKEKERAKEEEFWRKTQGLTIEEIVRELLRKKPSAPN